MSDQDFACQLRGWSLTTAEIMYRMPDYREILQTYIWQDYDLAPKFPKLIKFLDFWSHNLRRAAGLGAGGTCRDRRTRSAEARRPGVAPPLGVDLTWACRSRPASR